jgi:hypothetical protein
VYGEEDWDMPAAVVGRGISGVCKDAHYEGWSGTIRLGLESGMRYVGVGEQRDSRRKMNEDQLTFRCRGSFFGTIWNGVCACQC